MDESPKDTKTPAAPAAQAVKPAPQAGKPAAPAPAAKQPSRAARAFTRGLRWTLVFLIVFGAGILLALFAWYRPAVSLLNAANQQIAEVESQTSQRITSLQAEASTLPELQTQNQELGSALTQAQLHVTILSARADVAAAQLALAQQEPTKARLALSKTGETLKTMGTLLQTDQVKLAADMQNRLELAISEIGENQNAAESDLEVLATDLLELENAYFAKP